jgi:hypothetical protein
MDIPEPAHSHEGKSQSWKIWQNKSSRPGDLEGKAWSKPSEAITINHVDLVNPIFPEMVNYQ